MAEGVPPGLGEPAGPVIGQTKRLLIEAFVCLYQQLVLGCRESPACLGQLGGQEEGEQELVLLEE